MARYVPPASATCPAAVYGASVRGEWPKFLRRRENPKDSPERAPSRDRSGESGTKQYVGHSADGAPRTDTEWRSFISERPPFWGHRPSSAFAYWSDAGRALDQTSEKSCRTSLMHWPLFVTGTPTSSLTIS